jgi:uncharacterized damage-inducible protein DinB
MKELFVAFGRYNKKANASIFEAIAVMSADQLRHSIKAYYPTIVDTLFHTLKSDVKWLQRLSSFHESGITKDAAARFMNGEVVDLNRIIEDLRGFAELRTRVDAAMIATIDAIPEGALARDFEIELGPKRITRPLWQLLMQWFNHHTHHRGQASIQLDALGVDNDFSGVLDKIE